MELTDKEISNRLPLYFEFGDSDRPVKIVEEKSDETNEEMTRVYAMYDGKFEMRNDLFYKVLQKGYGVDKKTFDENVKKFKG